MAVGVSLIDVQARWGYSEIVDSVFADQYGVGQDMEALRTKRRSGIPFEQLSPDDCRLLASRCGGVRPNLLTYLSGIEGFDLVEIDRATLGALIVPPNVWRDSGGQFVPFSYYISTTTEEAGDARLLVIQPTDYRRPADPITVGRSDQFRIMIDGYHRAALFWKFGPQNGTLDAYMPPGI